MKSLDIVPDKIKEEDLGWTNIEVNIPELIIEPPSLPIEEKVKPVPPKKEQTKKAAKEPVKQEVKTKEQELDSENPEKKPPEPKSIPTLIPTPEDMEKTIALLFQQGGQFLEAGDLGEAFNCFRKIITYEPNQSFAHAYLAICYQKKYQFQEALSEIDLAIKIDPKVARFHCLQGEIFQKLNRTGEAIESFFEANRLERFNVEVMHSLAVIFFDLNDLDRSILWSKKALKVDRTHRHSWKNLALANFKLKNYAATISSVQNVDGFKEDVDLLYYLGKSYLESKNITDAVQYLKDALRVDKHHLQANLELGRYFYNEKNYDTALIHFRRCSKINDRLDISWFNMGIIHKIKGNHAIALDYLEKAISCNHKFYQAYIEVGHLYIMIKDYDIAKQNFLKALSLQESNPQSYYSLGILNQTLNHKKESLENYKTAFKLGMKHPSFLYKLAKAYLKNNQYEEALQIYLKFGSKNTSEGFIGQGECYYALGKLNDARKSYERALLADSNSILAVYRIWQMNIEQGNKEPARYLFEKALPMLGQTIEDNYYKGRMAFHYERIFLAKEYFQFFLNERDVDPEGVTEIVKIPFVLGQYDEVYALYLKNSLIKSALKDLPAKKKIELQSIIAHSCMALGQYKEAKQLWQVILDTQERHLDALYFKGLSCLNLEEFSSAEQVFRLIENITDGDPRQYLLSGFIKTFKKQWVGAEKDFDFVIKNFPSLGDGVLAKAKYYTSTDRLSEGINILERFLRNQPDNKEVLAQYGIACVKGGLYQRAIQAFERCIKDQNGLLDSITPYFQVWQELLQLYIRFKEVKKGIRLVEQFYKNFALDCVHYVSLGRLYLLENAYGKAQNCFDKVMNDFGDIKEAVLGIAEIQMAKGAFLRALPDLKMLVERFPHFKEAHIKLAECYQNSQSTELAEKHYEEAIGLIKEELKSQVSYGKVTEVGQLFEATGHYSEAESYYKQAYEICTMNPESSFNYGRILSRTEKFQKSTQILLRHIADCPDNREAYEVVAHNHYEQADYLTAINFMQDALALDQSNIKNYFKLGQIYIHTKNFKEAMGTFEKCIELEPQNIAARLELARLYTLHGESEQAINKYEEVLDLDTNNCVAHFELGRVYLEQVEPQKAEAHFAKAAIYGHKQAGIYRKYYNV